MTEPPSSPWKRRVLIAGGVLLALVLLFQLVVPRIVASQLVDAVATALGRQVRIGELDLDWLPGRVAVTDLQIGGPLEAPPVPPERALLRFARLGIDLSWSSLLGGELHLSELSLQSPELFLEREPDGSLVPVVLAEPEAEAEAEAETSDAQEDEGGAWPIRLDALRVDDLVLHVQRPGETPPRELEFRLASFSLSHFALRDGAVEVGAIAFEEPGLRVQRSIASAPQREADPDAEGAAHPPPSQAARQETAPATEPAQGEGASPGDYQLESLDVNGADLVLLWEGGEPLDVRLDLSARNLSTRPGARFPLELALHVEGADIVLEGEVGTYPVVFDGTLRWQALPLPRLLEASGAGAGAGIALSSGTSAGELQLGLVTRAEAERSPGIELSGDAKVAELEGRLPDLELAWEQLEVQAEAVSIPFEADAAFAIDLARVSLASPRIVYERSAPPTTETRKATQSAEGGGDTADPGAETPAPRISVARLVVEDGDVRFRDATPKQAFETHWTQVAIDARGLRWPERDAESVKVTAQGSGGSRLAVDASFDDGQGRIETTLDRVALVPMDPYAAEYTGIRIDEGRTSVRSVVDVGEDRVRTDTKVDLHGLSLHESEAGWFKRVFGMPLDLALALLRDVEGDIHVPVRAEFGGDQVDVGLVSVLASTLRQAVTGALTSPLKLLGSVRKKAGDALGSGIEPIEVVEGEPALEASSGERLRVLAETLDEKPELAVALRGRAGAADDAGIARRRLIEQARAGEDLDGEDQLGFFERRQVRGALEELDPSDPAALEPETEALVEKLVAAARVEDAQRRALGRERAVRARQVLVDDLQVADDAVVVEEGAVGDPGVEIELRARSPRAGDDADDASG